MLFVELFLCGNVVRVLSCDDGIIESVFCFCFKRVESCDVSRLFVDIGFVNKNVVIIVVVLNIWFLKEWFIYFCLNNMWLVLCRLCVCNGLMINCLYL